VTNRRNHYIIRATNKLDEGGLFCGSLVELEGLDKSKTKRRYHLWERKSGSMWI